MKVYVGETTKVKNFKWLTSIYKVIKEEVELFEWPLYYHQDNNHFSRYLYTRWMDSGNLEGFVSAKEPKGKGENISSDKDHIKWQAMTWSDLEKRSKHYKETLDGKRSKLSGRY